MMLLTFAVVACFGLVIQMLASGGFAKRLFAVDQQALFGADRILDNASRNFFDVLVVLGLSFPLGMSQQRLKLGSPCSFWQCEERRAVEEFDWRAIHFE